jgi:hypothetical protein
MFSPIAQQFLGVSAVTRGNVRVPVKLSDACPFSADVARFHVFAHRLAFLRVFARKQGIVCVPIKLSDACSFTPDVARFHVFALHLAIFMRFRCNTGQHTCPCQVMRRLPVFARRCPFPRFRPSISHFQVFSL